MNYRYPSTQIWLGFKDSGAITTSAPNTYWGSSNALEHYQCPHCRSNQKWMSVWERLPQLFRGISAGRTAYLITQTLSREIGTRVHVHSKHGTSGIPAHESIRQSRLQGKDTISVMLREHKAPPAIIPVRRSSSCTPSHLSIYCQRTYSDQRAPFVSACCRHFAQSSGRWGKGPLPCRTWRPASHDTSGQLRCLWGTSRLLRRTPISDARYLFKLFLDALFLPADSRWHFTRR